MSDELMIKEEKVLEAAKLGYREDKLLRILFPEVFEKQKPEIDLTKLRVISSAEMARCDPVFSNVKEAGFTKGFIFAIRGSGDYENKAFYLDNRYNWSLARDHVGALVLVPNHIEEDDQ